MKIYVSQRASTRTLNVLNSNKENKQKNESETENGRIMKDDRNKVSVIDKL